MNRKKKRTRQNEDKHNQQSYKELSYILTSLYIEAVVYLVCKILCMCITFKSKVCLRYYRENFNSVKEFAEVEC